jgi:phosphoribosyl 1,2-cyclic phosphodiesterase
VKVSVLGSGSRGNSVLVVGGETKVLVDAGFSAKSLETRLGHLGLLPEEIDGIVVTHDHGDHTRGVGVFARRHATPVFLTDLTREACGSVFRGEEDLRSYRAGFPFQIGSLEVVPFLTAHDARDPVAVSLVHADTGLKLGIATDLGRPTAQVRLALSECDALVLEANHDPGLLHQGPYPPSVRARIASSHGHLSNEAAAQLAVELLHPRLAAVVLAHLSAECNRPSLAEAVVDRALRDAGYRGLLLVAEQDTATPLMDVGRLRRSLEPDQLPLI